MTFKHWNISLTTYPLYAMLLIKSTQCVAWKNVSQNSENILDFLLSLIFTNLEKIAKFHKRYIF